MIEEPGSFSGIFNSAKPGARSAGHQANVVGDLVERHRQRAQRAGELNQGIMRALHREFVGRGDKGQTGELGDLGGRRFAKSGRRVDAGPDRRAAERQAVHALAARFDPLKIVRRACRHSPTIPGPSVSGVASCIWVRPILTMSFQAPALLCDRIAQGGHRRDEPLLHVDGRRDVHGRRERVVRRLRHVDVIVGMNRRLAAERRACKLAAAVGDHLVDVHVELGAAARHPDMQRKHVVMLAGEDLVADLNDQFVALVVEPLAGVVGDGGGFLQAWRRRRSSRAASDPCRC